MTSNNNNKTLKKKKTERPEIMRGDEKKTPKERQNLCQKVHFFYGLHW